MSEQPRASMGGDDSYRMSPAHGPSARQLEEIEQRRRRNPLTWLREIFTIVIVALIISTLLRAFVVQVFWIPSPSMKNTLIENDRIAVSRIDALTGNIRRGDVVVFHDDLNWLSSGEQSPAGMAKFLTGFGEFVGFIPSGGEQTLVKRVIGVGGDRVTCCTANGNLTVNGQEINETYVADGQVASAKTFDVTVPEGTLWVMGDNRGNSADSRFHMGEGSSPFVSTTSVVGTVQAIIFPFNRWSTDIGHREVFSHVPGGTP